MIGYLNGIARGTDVLLVGGVGYLVTVPGGLEDGEHVALDVITSVREDAFDLYGFRSALDAQVFRIVLKAQGVGARTAIAMLTTLGAGPLARAVAGNDPATLAQTPGVGPKLAQKMIASITIPDALLIAAGAGRDERPIAEETTDPLVGYLVTLGYSPNVAADAVKAARVACGVGAEEADLIRVALRTAA